MPPIATGRTTRSRSHDICNNGAAVATPAAETTETVAEMAVAEEKGAVPDEKGKGPEVIGKYGNNEDSGADAGGGDGVLWIFLGAEKNTPFM